MAIFQEAFETRNIEIFMRLVFPKAWGGIIARILETGAEMSDDPVPWAPRWSPVSPTVRGQSGSEFSQLKSVMYRAHDCLHQLWGLPVPRNFTEDERYYFKRVNMCSEVAVLTITEFFLADYLHNLLLKNFNDQTIYESKRQADFILTRNALPMKHNLLVGKSMLDVAGRLDDLLHKKSRPRWVRHDATAMAFCDDYVPMLEFDRESIERQWQLMVKLDWKPSDIPDVRPAVHLDGLELTRWMIHDFEHLIDTDTDVDRALVAFNRERRRKIILPDGWN